VAVGGPNARRRAVGVVFDLFDHDAVRIRQRHDVEVVVLAVQIPRAPPRVVAVPVVVRVFVKEQSLAEVASSAVYAAQVYQD